MEQAKEITFEAMDYPIDKEFWDKELPDSDIHLWVVPEQLDNYVNDVRKYGYKMKLILKRKHGVIPNTDGKTCLYRQITEEDYEIYYKNYK